MDCHEASSTSRVKRIHSIIYHCNSFAPRLRTDWGIAIPVLQATEICRHLRGDRRVQSSENAFMQHIGAVRRFILDDQQQPVALNMFHAISLRCINRRICDRRFGPFRGQQTQQFGKFRMLRIRSQQLIFRNQSSHIRIVLPNQPNRLLVDECVNDEDFAILSN